MTDTDREQELRDKIAALEAELSRAQGEALTDWLTGCLNRRGWERALAGEQDRCARHGLSASIVVVDLDGFKEINDVRGHEQGDALLRRCARALRRAIRQHDQLARTGGDEFAVLAVQTDTEPLEAIDRRLRDALCRAGVGASIGMATADARETELVTAWQEADRRMLAVKREARAPGRERAG